MNARFKNPHGRWMDVIIIGDLNQENVQCLVWDIWFEDFVELALPKERIHLRRT